MSYTMEDFRRDYVKEHLQELTLEERLDGLEPKELLQLRAEIEKHLKEGEQQPRSRKRGRKR